MSKQVLDQVKNLNIYSLAFDKHRLCLELIFLDNLHVKYQLPIIFLYRIFREVMLNFALN